MMMSSNLNYMYQDIADLLFHDKVSKRDKWMEIFKDPLWTPIFNTPLEKQRDHAYQMLKKVMHSGVVSVLNFIDDPTNIFTAHEMLGCVNGSGTTKFTVHMNLFGNFHHYLGGSIVALHTERHKWIF